MKRTLNPNKIRILRGMAGKNASANDPFYIEYEGEGGDYIPASMWQEIMSDIGYGNSIVNNLPKILFEAVKHSQYIKFEEIK